MESIYITPEHELLREQVARFIEREVEPHGAGWEEAGMVSREVWLKAGEQGFLLPWAEEEYGGLGLKDFRYEQIMCEELARTPGPESIPVVVLTAWNDRPEVLESKNPRIAGYITKPFRLEDVRRMLDRVFAGKSG